MAARRRPRCLPRLAVATLALLAVACVILAYHQYAALSQQLSQSQMVGLLTVLPRCIQPQGQFYLTKLLQTKVAYARAKGWTMWALGPGELEAAAASLMIRSDTDAPPFGALWPALILNALASTKLEWIVWMDAEVLVSSPHAAMPWTAWSDADIILPMWPVATDADLAFAFVRNSDPARALLSAWADAIATASAAGGTDEATASRALKWVMANGRGGGARVLRLGTETTHLMTRLSSPVSSSENSSAATMWLFSFRGCGLCDANRASSSSRSTAACRRALMRVFTASDNAGPLRAAGAQHAAPGSIHVRPSIAAGRAGGGWLERHRGGLASCLPSLLVVGSSRAALGTLHWVLRNGWHPRIAVNTGGDRDLHFYSMDNRWKDGLWQYEQRFHRESKRRFGCKDASRHDNDGGRSSSTVVAEISSSYFDYPKAPARVASVLPAARIVVVLREPIDRAYSAFNFRWLTWLCGKLLWTRQDCWAAVTSEAAIKEAQVGPFQKHAALKLWRSCSGADGRAPSLKCLQRDFGAKLRNKSDAELATLEQCTGKAEAQGMPASVNWAACLQLHSVMLGPKQIHKVMEDSSFLWRSMYVHHLRTWLRLYAAEQLMVVDPAQLFRSSSGGQQPDRAVDASATLESIDIGAGAPPQSHAMHELTRFALRLPPSTASSAGTQGLPAEPSEAEGRSMTKDALLDKGMHENARRYVVGERGRPPADVEQRWRAWLQPHNCDLAGVLLRRGLAAPLARGSWLAKELTSTTAWRDGLEGPGDGVCSGVHSVDEWFVGL